MFSVPNLLAMFRLIVGPIYLGLGTVPVSNVQLTVLLFAGATDLIDGRIARAWNVTSTFGRFLDPLADRLLIACVLVKLALAEFLPWWIILVVLSQYIALSAVFMAYNFQYGRPPAPDLWARLGAGIAAVAGIVGVTGMSIVATLVLVLLFIVANSIYFAVVGARVARMRSQRAI